MATEAGVCPRLTAPIPLSEAKTAGRGGNGVEAQDEWSHRECQTGCRALRGNLRLSIGLAERQDRVEDEGRARYQ